MDPSRRPLARWTKGALAVLMIAGWLTGCGKPAQPRPDQAGSAPGTPADTPAGEERTQAPSGGFFGLTFGRGSRPSVPPEPAVETTKLLPALEGETLIPDGTPGVYKGNLTPEKSAEITNAIARLQYEEVSTKDLPKDPKVLMQINERIRKKSDALYAQYGTTMTDVSRFIRDLSPKDRVRFNNRLTELFLAENRKREVSRPAAQPTAGLR